jgi:hypothetical protein
MESSFSLIGCMMIGMTTIASTTGMTMARVVLANVAEGFLDSIDYVRCSATQILGGFSKGFFPGLIHPLKKGDLE